MDEKPTAEQLKERRAAWVAALRSGKYAQGKSHLARANGETSFCCLGVACEVAIESGLKIVKRKLENNLIQYESAIYAETGVLIPEVKDFFGLRDCNGLTSRGALTQKNNNGQPFSQIADFIESNPPGLWSE